MRLITGEGGVGAGGSGAGNGGAVDQTCLTESQFAANDHFFSEAAMLHVNTDVL